MMNKIILLLVLSVFLVGACSQQKTESLVGGGSNVPQDSKTSGTDKQTSGVDVGTIASSGNFKEFTITARQFQFEPSTIEVNKGDKVRLIVTSKDVPHGISIPEYSINERLEPNKPVTIEFTADKPGTFTVFCSVLCGSGHLGMKGKLIVR